MRVNPVFGAIVKPFKPSFKESNKGELAQNPIEQSSLPNGYHIYFTGSKSTSTTKKKVGQMAQKPYYDRDNNLLIEHPAYKKTAFEMGKVLMQDNRVSLEFLERDSLPEMVLDNFEILIKEGRFSKFGFTPEDTEFVRIQSSDIMIDGNNPLYELITETNDLEKAGKKPIVIIDDIYDMWSLLSDIEQNMMENSKRIADLPIITLYDQSKDDEGDFYDDCPLDYVSITTQHLTEGETRHFIKRQDVQDKFIFEGQDTGIIIDNEAINLAIKYCKHEHQTMPYDPMNLLKYTYNARLLKNDSREIRHITANDVAKANTNYREFNKSVPYMDSVYKLGDDPFKKKPVKNKIPKVKFSDVGGHHEVKTQIQTDLLNLINHPEVDRSDIPKGILFEGPSGTGKTLLAAAIAGEAGLPFIARGGSDFADRYVGETEKAIREIFEEAEKLAKESPNKACILFIDEVDALASKRKPNDTTGSDKAVDALLNELDGIEDKDGEKDYSVIFIAATNRKDLLDKAFLRPGRIDLKYKIDNPTRNKTSRREIIEIHAKKRPFKSEEEKDKLLSWLADSTKGFSGAEIADIFKKAQRMIYAPGREGKYLTKADLTEAMLQVDSGIKTKTDAPVWDNEKTIMHEAGHALNIVLTGRVFGVDEPWNMPTLELNFITNEGRGDYAGSTNYNYSDQNQRYTFASLIAKLVASYGGLSTERLIYGSNGDGVSGDLESITQTALEGVTKYGLGPNTGSISIPDEQESKFLTELYKDEIKKDLALMTKLAKDISDKMIKFNEGFIKEYLEEYRKNPAMKSEIITAERFKKMHNDWLEKEGKQEELDTLCAEIKKMITDAQKGSKA